MNRSPARDFFQGFNMLAGKERFIANIEPTMVAQPACNRSAPLRIVAMFASAAAFTFPQ